MRVCNPIPLARRLVRVARGPRHPAIVAGPIQHAFGPTHQQAHAKPANMQGDFRLQKVVDQIERAINEPTSHRWRTPSNATPVASSVFI